MVKVSDIECEYLEKVSTHTILKTNKASKRGKSEGER